MLKESVCIVRKHYGLLGCGDKIKARVIRPCHTRVAKFACPRVHDDQKMSEDNQNLRSSCPPDYQIFLEKYFENSCPYTFF